MGPLTGDRGSTHLVIPDTQSKPGTPSEHLAWIGEYIIDRKPDVVVHLGDHWDMPSLSSYDRGKRASEGRRYSEDVQKGNDDLALLTAPLWAHQASIRARRPLRRHEQYTPRLVLLRGNHEYRIERALEDAAVWDGKIGFDDLESPGWEVHDFREVVCIDGVYYSHYFYNPMTGRPYGGQSIDTRLKTVGSSFTMGHQQGLWYGLRPTIGGMHHGLVAGSCYLHDEDYLGPQANDNWRGIVVCHQVENGSYDPMFVSLDFLCRKYEAMPLERFMFKKGYR